MAKVWFVREGIRPTVGGPEAERPLANCKDMLQLTKDQYLGEDVASVRFGETGAPFSAILGNQHVVVEISEEEALATGWKRGYYRSPLSPEHAFQLLGLKPREGPAQ